MSRNRQVHWLYEPIILARTNQSREIDRGLGNIPHLGHSPASRCARNRKVLLPNPCTLVSGTCELNKCFEYLPIAAASSCRSTLKLLLRRERLSGSQARKRIHKLKPMDPAAAATKKRAPAVADRQRKLAFFWAVRWSMCVDTHTHVAAAASLWAS